MKKTLQKSAEEIALPIDKRSKIVSWFSALKHSWRTALRIDRTQITALPAIRSTIAFVLPLALGVATGHVVEGVSMAGGAASLGAVGLTFTHRARTRTLLLACAGIAISAFVGAITGPVAWLAILVAGLWGIGAGLLVSVSQTAMIAGLQSTVALLILSHFALDPAHAAIQATLMFAGALLQTLLAIIPLPWQHTAVERAVLSAAYQKLADYALDPSGEQSGQQARDALLKAHSTVSDSNIQSSQGKLFFGLLEEAERIRLSLIVLTRLRQNLAKDTAARAGSVEYLDQIIQSAAGELRQIAYELQPPRPFNSFSRPHQEIKKSLTALRRQDTTLRDDETLQQTLAYCDILRDQLHKAKKLAKACKYTHLAGGQKESKHPSVRVTLPRQARLRLHNAQEILRANLTLRSAASRHALRLGVTLALATALYRIFPLPLQRGYWIPLTALLVLKPDFKTTFARGAARSLGTMLGAVLTTLLVAILAPTQELLVILDTIMAYLAFSFLYANYAIFSAFITMETVFLLTFVTPQPLATAAYRAIDTAIGGILALLIYALWPTWERSQVLGNIANRLEALRRYFVAVMDAYAHPDAYDALSIHSRLRDSRLARSNAQASVERSLQEPEPHRIDIDLAHGLLAAADNIAQSVLALEAYLLDNPSRHALPQISAFTTTVDEALSLLATAIREQQPVTALPNLQEALRTLEHAGKSGNHAQNAASTDLHFVKSEVKHITRSISAMSQLLSTKAAEYVT